ncbi:hypothetical protein COCMIDRAFT_101513 [Bipolaris oryzae ATCC 44560]|uniref:Uncharacterized protein n=1 Tax=Bipolaris oryzae ATCC 44560 TaxID=930090 RepID=W6Z6P4_COCMI|nr:uncharacterized protein COCMIDRAFT_101513 [Bipolaris oryzae ATCC 44560]EUC43194.1 hypothetical protein COCMIDRAFT_101513 [Bipolaris oryzae ATCC 44560]
MAAVSEARHVGAQLDRAGGFGVAYSASCCLTNPLQRPGSMSISLSFLGFFCSLSP